MSTFEYSNPRRIQRKAFQANSNRTKSQNIQLLTIEIENIYNKPATTENISPKSMIFYLAIRKAYKNTSLRYIKFAFYLIRSLFKELQLLPSKRDRLRKPLGLIKKKQFLSKTLAAYNSQLVTNKLQKFFIFCKELAIFKVKKLEKIQRFSNICYKDLQAILALLSNNLQSHKNKNTNCFIKLIGKIIIDRISMKIKENQIVSRTYSVLSKPRYNLPFIKTEQIAIISHTVYQNKSPTPRSTYLQQFRHKINKNTNLIDRAVFHIQLFNKHYCYIRRLAFKKICDYCRVSREAEYLTRRTKAIDSIKKLLLGAFTGIVYQIITRCSKSFTLIRKEQNETRINNKELVSFGKLLADVIFNRKFSAFMHVKYYTNREERIGFMLPAIKFMVKTISEILRFSRDKTLQGIFSRLKHIYRENIHNENVCYLIKIIKEINLKKIFLNYLAGFNSLKLWAIHKHSLELRKGSKLLFILNKQYNKLTALGFIFWKNEIVHGRYLFPIIKSNRLIERHSLRYEQPFESKSSRILPLPKDIHDYIDDIQTLSRMQIPCLYNLYNRQ